MPAPNPISVETKVYVGERTSGAKCHAEEETRLQIPGLLRVLFTSPTVRRKISIRLKFTIIENNRVVSSSKSLLFHFNFKQVIKKRRHSGEDIVILTANKKMMACKVKVYSAWQIYISTFSPSKKFSIYAEVFNFKLTFLIRVWWQNRQTKPKWNH